MLVYCTYCSAEKKQLKTLLPAIELYSSKRISEVSDLAKINESKFMILSGKYGLIEDTQKIGYYDHLLSPEEVEKHSNKVTQQLKAKKISTIIFYTRSIEQDKNLQPYIDCIKKASLKSDVKLEIKELAFDD